MTGKTAPAALSEATFEARYGTEGQCFEALARWRWPEGFECPSCKGTEHCVLTHRQLMQCYRCRRQTSITAGTTIESTKIALTKWFRGLYMITRDAKGCSTAELARTLAISYNAAWRMKRKLVQLDHAGLKIE